MMASLRPKDNFFGFSAKFLAENAETAKFGRERSLIECCNQDVTKPNQRMCCVHGLVYFRLSNITSGWGGKLFCVLCVESKWEKNTEEKTLECKGFLLFTRFCRLCRDVRTSSAKFLLAKKQCPPTFSLFGCMSQSNHWKKFDFFNKRRLWCSWQMSRLLAHVNQSKFPKNGSSLFRFCPFPWVDAREWPKWAFLGNFRQPENWSETAQTSPNFTPKSTFLYKC